MTAQSFSFGVLKPDCVQRGLVERAFALITERGLRVILRKKIIFSRTDVAFLYRRLIEKDFFPRLADFMTSAEIIVFVVQSENSNAIHELNSVTGHTDPAQAKPKTLRRMGENICRNISHSSSDEVTAREDFLYFFSEEELRNVGLA